MPQIAAAASFVCQRDTRLVIWSCQLKTSKSIAAAAALYWCKRVCNVCARCVVFNPRDSQCCCVHTLVLMRYGAGRPRVVRERARQVFIYKWVFPQRPHSMLAQRHHTPLTLSLAHACARAGLYQYILNDVVRAFCCCVVLNITASVHMSAMLCARSAWAPSTTRPPFRWWCVG